jgi:hypothetical protein
MTYYGLCLKNYLFRIFYIYTLYLEGYMLNLRIPVLHLVLWGCEAQFIPGPPDP